MEEPAANNAEREIELVMGDESMLIGDNGDSLQPNAMFLTELNLLLVVLSMFALFDEECVNLSGREKRRRQRSRGEGFCNEIADQKTRNQCGKGKASGPTITEVPNKA
ncbi:hypothetical protein SLE2022_029390 [Rubroshorea leprosula]